MTCLTPEPARTFVLSSFCGRIIMAAIKAHGITDAERKERIMLARQCGFLSDEATEDYILHFGLVNA
ncbi:hypothetical protein UFOVP5_45 [uncultured Caudovirales phage]|uniref:Uncharacterized protein n=1 Tax=uncultured Caudovirales phage TaxID=2100421 RepID=A0A6J5KFU1_9CAUD|nr:hypothetical protein UFOVP5_45 [uncultured Caudovirales phage]